MSDDDSQDIRELINQRDALLTVIESLNREVHQLNAQISSAGYSIEEPDKGVIPIDHSRDGTDPDIDSPSENKKPKIVVKRIGATL